MEFEVVADVLEFAESLVRETLRSAEEHELELLRLWRDEQRVMMLQWAFGTRCCNSPGSPPASKTSQGESSSPQWPPANRTARNDAVVARLKVAEREVARRKEQHQLDITLIGRKQRELEVAQVAIRELAIELANQGVDIRLLPSLQRSM